MAQVLFLTVIRWPAPLRAQRRETAAAYRALSALAGAPGRSSSLPAANVLDKARDGMSAPALFGDSALTALRSLLEEGFRIRVALSAIRAAERPRDAVRGGARRRRRAPGAAPWWRSTCARSVIEGDSSRARRADRRGRPAHA